MQIGNTYTYHVIKKVGPSCRKHAIIKEVTFTGMEGDNYIFETEYGTEILIHKDDLRKRIMEVD